MIVHIRPTIIVILLTLLSACTTLSPPKLNKHNPVILFIDKNIKRVGFTGIESSKVITDLSDFFLAFENELLKQLFDASFDSVSSQEYLTVQERMKSKYRHMFDPLTGTIKQEIFRKYSSELLENYTQLYEVDLMLSIKVFVESVNTRQERAYWRGVKQTVPQDYTTSFEYLEAYSLYVEYININTGQKQSQILGLSVVQGAEDLLQATNIQAFKPLIKAIVEPIYQQ